MKSWNYINDVRPEEGQVVIYSLDKVNEVTGIFHYFQIGPLPPVPCFSSDIGWIAAEWWRETDEQSKEGI